MEGAAAPAQLPAAAALPEPAARRARARAAGRVRRAERRPVAVGCRAVALVDPAVHRVRLLQPGANAIPSRHAGALEA